MSQSAESAIGFGGRLQRLHVTGLRILGSCSIPTAPTNLIHSTAFVFAFDTNSPFDTNCIEGTAFTMICPPRICRTCGAALNRGQTHCASCAIPESKERFIDVAKQGRVA